MYRSEVGNLSYCEFMSVTAVSCSEDTISQQSFHPLAHRYFLFPFLSQMFPEPWLGGTDILLRALHLVSYSLHFGQSCISVLTAAHWKTKQNKTKADVIVVEKSQVYACKHNYLEGNLMVDSDCQLVVLRDA